MAEEVERKPQKTWTLSTRQLGGSAALIAGVAAMAPIKEWFYTRAEGEAQLQRVNRIELVLSELKLDLKKEMDRNTDKVIDRIKESEERTVKNADRIERRIDFLEASDKPKKSKGNI
jgi:hypothetical protein